MCDINQYNNTKMLPCINTSFSFYLDPCRGLLTGTIPNQDVCSGYWSCINGAAFGSCCAKPNQRYIPSLGCIDDVTCMMSCPPEDPAKYINAQGKQLRVHHRPICLNCGTGYQFVTFCPPPPTHQLNVPQLSRIGL